MIAARVVNALIGFFEAHGWGTRRTLSPERLRAELAQPQPPLVLDVRNADEFVGELGHIDGAVLIPLPELEKRLDELVPHRERRIVAV
jgi:rhodanese-related sulfurtransferase